MNAEQIDQFERIQAQMRGLHIEIEVLSKKKPDDALNRFKLGFVNQILDKANELLGEKGRPFEDFEQFDEDALPTNSDVVLMLTQYLKCLERLRSINIGRKGLHWCWIIDGELSNRGTSQPTHS